jgi:hypothetical protein
VDQTGLAAARAGIGHALATTLVCGAGKNLDIVAAITVDEPDVDHVGFQHFADRCQQ